MKSDFGFTGPEDFRERLAEPVAQSLYDDIRKNNRFQPAGPLFRKKFADLGETEKQFWIEYASGTPEKYSSIGLFPRPYREYCRTCIITGSEIENLISDDLDRFPDEPRTSNRNLLFSELNYFLPASLKKAGLELIRQVEVAEIDLSLMLKIARVVHAGYLHEMTKQASGIPEEKRSEAVGFDDLPHEILQSNVDFAVHLPTRLLAIGYRIRPVRKGFKPRALHLDDMEVETMAKVEHLRWSWEKRLDGWTYGEVKDSRKKRHPCLVPYDELSEGEKEKDRELVRLTPAILRDIRYEAYPVSSGQISKLSYAVKPRSSIHKLLSGTGDLTAGINELAEDSPLIREKLSSIDEKIRLTLSEVEGSYNYARHIQEAFLPDDLDIRECFPESFVLFEPKDIVSGDFYMFDRHDGNVIFALADCTGHGIPAALISTIGYGILDQTVNILKIKDPAEALCNLFSRIHRFLRKDTAVLGVSDDMAIVLCSLNTLTNTLTYSGAGNIVFHVTGGKISGNLSGNSYEGSYRNGRYDFKAKSLQLKLNDSLYICSDGFADQFGGGRHLRYSRKRLRDFLLQICDYPMPEQGDMLFEELERWREDKNCDEDQTDDITIIGIRV
ncbi:MAG: SpoIIE family protein phosphatase [Bacteroidales bacterium]|nr:SpoIIE family protein phosphatase [Bacteroidales bacterium]